MPGHIYQSAKGWRAMIDIGPDPVTGKRRQRRLGPYRSRREAERGVAKMLLDVQAGQAVDPGLGVVSLADYLRDQWLPARELRGLKPTTLANYRWVYETYLIPRLGNHRLRDVSPREIVAFFEAFSKETGRLGKPRSTRTVALTHRVLSMALGHAVRAGIIARNPAEGARDDLPRAVPQARNEMWTLEQLGRFLDATTGDRLHPLWVLAITTGMRRGELCGLHWEDIDFEQGFLTVRRARVMVHGVATDTTPKTAAGQRRISLDEGTLAILQDHERRQLAEEQGCAPGFWQGTGYVFTDEIGRPLIPEYVTKRFGRAVREAALPKLRLHDLRHWHATAMLRAGVDVKIASERLGHSSTALTQNIYQHRVEQLDRLAAEKVAKLVFDATKYHRS